VDSKNDIRVVTMTSKVDPDELAKGAGWNDVNGHSKKKIPLRHAIISPPKQQTRSSYKKGSPSYNKYDPTGKIHRKSQRIQNLKDHSNHQKKSMNESDQGT
jgi:hypothetical protein